jgi:uncharacterized protein YjiS (DUF1127 family)
VTDVQFLLFLQYRFLLSVHDRLKIYQSVMQNKFLAESVLKYLPKLNYLYLNEQGTEMKLVKANPEKPLLYRLIKRLELYAQRSRTRKYLLTMDDYALKDIGITRQQALQEARLYFWQGDDQLLAGDCADESVPEKENLIKLSQSV